ncbi:MAG: PBP1A family penicillin-binding protein [Acidimicrobiia bacterium]|nr:PBP1A family penicillin-binding protein [Acidimicrobiia bacterium]
MWLMGRTGSWRARVAVVALLMALLVGAAACSYTTDISEPDREPATSTILDRNGEVITTLHAGEDREPVTLDQITPTLQDAVVAIEDERFYTHSGVDAKAVSRALAHDLGAGKVEEGGSTITQQYVRSALLDPERSVDRKVREAVLAWELERELTKDEILERYLNAVYFGDGAYGAQAAAKHYFAKPASQLTLEQSALLAGLLQAPERYNPLVAPDVARDRRDTVLDKMLEQGMIDEAAHDEAIATDVVLAASPTGDSADDTYPAPHFVDRVIDEIVASEEFGGSPEERRNLLYTGGLTIETGLDLEDQRLAEEAVGRVVSEPDTDPAAALVSIDPAGGEVRAYVGGSDYFGTAGDAQFDLAGQGVRQAGSAFKPFALVAALEAGYTTDRTYPAPSSIEIPLPAPQEAWEVHNYDDRGGGELDLIEATVQSVNTVYAQLTDDLGAPAVVEAATRLGIASPLEPVASVALGTNGVTTLDMASAYGTLASGGTRSGPTFVTRVTAADGRVLYEADHSSERVLDEAVASEVTDVLRQVPERGTAVNARIGRPIAGKTGTTEEEGDAWFVGYTPELVTAVWVGFPDAPARWCRPRRGPPSPEGPGLPRSGSSTRGPHSLMSRSHRSLLPTPRPEATRRFPR